MATDEAREVRELRSQLARIAAVVSGVEVPFEPGREVTVADRVEQLAYQARADAEDCARVRKALRPFYPDEPDQVRAGWLAKECAAHELSCRRDGRYQWSGGGLR